MAKFKGIDREGQEILLDEDTVAAAQNNPRLDPRSGVQAITSDQLRDQDPMELPEPPTPSGAGEEISSIAEITTKRRQEAEQQRTEAREDFRGTLDDIIGVQGSRADLEDEAGIPEKMEALDEIDTEIEAKQLALRRKKEAILNAPGTATASQKNIAIQEIERKGNMELADLAIIRNASDRKLTTAQNLVKNKIELALEPLKLKFDFHEKLYDESRDYFDEAEQRELDQMIKREEREYEEEQTRLETLESMKLDLLQQAVENGAPATVLTAIQTSETPEDAVLNAGRFGQDMKSGTSTTDTSTTTSEFEQFKQSPAGQAIIREFEQQAQSFRDRFGGQASVNQEALNQVLREEFTKQTGREPEQPSLLPENVFETPDGREINVTSASGVKELNQTYGFSPGEIQAYLTEEIGLSVSVASQLVEDALGDSDGGESDDLEGGITF